jgi:hypothetical protein
MKIGDLAETVTGNLVLIIEIGEGRANIMFTSNGKIRADYPWEWLRSWECK